VNTLYLELRLLSSGIVCSEGRSQAVTAQHADDQFCLGAAGNDRHRHAIHDLNSSAPLLLGRRHRHRGRALGGSSHPWKPWREAWPGSLPLGGDGGASRFAATADLRRRPFAPTRAQSDYALPAARRRALSASVSTTQAWFPYRCAGGSPAAGESPRLRSSRLAGTVTRAFTPADAERDGAPRAAVRRSLTHAGRALSARRFRRRGPSSSPRRTLCLNTPGGTVLPECAMTRRQRCRWMRPRPVM
jgi:hypothetical protein